MSLISIPNTFTVGAVIVASQHNSNFSTIYSDYNGNIDNTNLSASAAIADTKLAQITTAGKVSGAALTSLSSVPSGAGIIPVANIDVGTTASKIVQLTGAAKLPAVDGSLVTNLNITGIVGSPISRSATTIYQAATDGVVIVVNTPGSSTYNVSLVTDSSATPTTRRGITSSAGGALINASFMVIIKKNDYYQVTTSGSASLESYVFIPIGA